ncbi:hypothetical protein BX600DRAFT_511556 [Xylariales sp. PMI_506]|nr:hypothetical protein BX600DRAFT_511556 [Xylariales sp. PMI_506]
MSRIKDLLLPMDEPILRPYRSRISTNKANPAFADAFHFVIEVILDTTCPNSYIGLKTLSSAIEIYKQRHPGATFEITCSPFLLDPTAGRSVDMKASYYIRGRRIPPSMLTEWNIQGAEVGINFSWQGRTGNSRDSHKLLRLALEASPTSRRSSSFASIWAAPQQQYHPPPPTSSSGSSSSSSPFALPPISPYWGYSAGAVRGPQIQLRLLEAIYSGYFEHDYDISSREWLLSLGTALLPGVSPTEIHACLESETWDQTVDGLSEANKQEFQLTAVPAFILQSRYVAYGWRTTEQFLNHFDMTWSQSRSGGVS